MFNRRPSRSSIDGSRALRILHVSQPGDAGVAHVVAGLARHQASSGFDVIVAGPGDSWLSEQIEAPVRYVVWDSDRSPRRGLIAESRALREVIDHARPDVVHLHSSKSGFVGRLVVRGSRPTVFQPHAWSFSALQGPARKAASIWERLALTWTDEIICLSEEELRLGRSLGATPCTLIPNGVDLNYWTPRARDDARARLGVEVDARLVLCVGRLAEQKGQLPFVHAWREVLSRVPGAVLALVGTGPLERQVHAAYEGLDVRYDDSCTDPRDWYAAADLVVAPSLWEGAALVPLEAMAMGRAVVGFDVGGLAAVVDDTTLVVPVSDHSALTDAIVKALSDPFLGPRMRARVSRHYDAAASYEGFSRVARRAAGSHH